ncbi:hypothetical protein THRCLA_00776 [Thraustotheca clavata]|uniref:NADP-dependent oxidoreductase domain-containing protein n=1 Tax=Thraustotheca clavata TaxID=74557 RepID=A0A1W0AA97_9STRA|nr:hypothetical protein THRCLA_00776 [Thraustotheca clavata]
MLRCVRWNPRWKSGVSLLHLGRATAEDTSSFTSQVNSKRLLRFPTENVTITPLGYGSPTMFTKESRMLDHIKDSVLVHNNNVIQTHFWYAAKDSEAVSLAYTAEPVAINELFGDDEVSRNSIVLTAILDDKLDGPALNPLEKLSKEAVKYQLDRIRRALDIEVLDIAFLRLPAEVIESSSKAVIQETIAALEEAIAEKQIQGYGFAFPSTSTTIQTETFIQNVLFADDVWRSGCVALQIPINIQEGLTFDLHQKKQVALFGELPLDIHVKVGRDVKPLNLSSVPEKLSGEEIALKLKESFSFALNVEQKYRETIHPANSATAPSPDDIAWAHILAYQHEQFNNFAEWVYIRETQISPRIEETLNALNQVEGTKEFAFAYSVAIRELLRYFDASIEMIARNLNQDIQTKLQEIGVEAETLQEAVIHTALSSNADCIVVGEDLPTRGGLMEKPKLSREIIEAVNSQEWQ